MVSSLEVFGECRAGLPLADADIRGQPFSRDIELINVVVDEVKEVAHFLIWRRLGERGGASELVVEAGKLLAVSAISLVAGNQGTGKTRSVLGDQLQFLEVGLIAVEDGVGQRFGDSRQQPVVVPSEMAPMSIWKFSANARSTAAETGRWLFSIWFR